MGSDFCIENTHTISFCDITLNHLNLQDGSVSVFMGVPTMYSHLLSALHRMPTAEQETYKRAASKLRLFVCGSSACPTSVMQRWKEATGHILLERYGMTEIGMALSNPLDVSAQISASQICTRGSTRFCYGCAFTFCKHAWFAILFSGIILL